MGSSSFLSKLGAPLVAGDADQRANNSIAKSLNSLNALPILDGTLVENVALDCTKTNLVPHKLGRKYRGYILVNNPVKRCRVRARSTSTAAMSAGAATWTDVPYSVVTGAYGTQGDINESPGTAVYDTSTYVFTAPVTGYYTVSCAITFAHTIASDLNLLEKCNAAGADNHQLDLTVGHGTGNTGMQGNLSFLATAGTTHKIRVWHLTAGAPVWIANVNFINWELDPLNLEIDSNSTADKAQILPLLCRHNATVSLWVF